MRIGSIVFDVRDFEGMVRFWSGAMHYVPREPPSDGWVVLSDPSGRGPNISINRDEDVRPLISRLHLDLYTVEQEAEVSRLIGLGATLHRSPEHGEDFVVLADPEGNLFCVVDATAE